MNPSFPVHQPNIYNIMPPQLPQIPQLPQLPQIPLQVPPTPPVPTSASTTPPPLTKAQRRMLGESEAARAKRLAKNAERMRQKRATESYDEYKIRLAKNAEANRRRRQNESDAERALRHMRNAMRQRLRRAMETPDQKAIRKAKLAQRMREIRATETPDQRKIRLEKAAARARHKFLTESSEERMERNRKKAEYARLFRNNKQQNQPAQEQVQDLTPMKNTNPNEIKAEQQPPPQTNATNTTHHNPTVIPQNPEPAPPICRDQPYPPASKNYPINYHEFGAAFPTFFNYPHLKNGQQSSYSPVYPSQSYYPDLSVPTHYGTKNDRTTFPAEKPPECVQPSHQNHLKGTTQKN
ncbi:ensconsin-like isoform X1 [Aedes albopictus]|uniref:STPR domain-containing protein n=1 Tax=Aedes albopictus TaxID=7160 RepID=A0ABM1Y5Z1_AEDAL|nr:ensconsin-like isoform X1 [Aedes albopictus]XP_019534973.2 ensconsin-like isoform X1 [Aedes albopictus]XP_019534974.2 ensconsin-like isoform X1 [Aedes albopictus]KXJ68555.1 hypothetical protein RP20_CCG002756 [Aedes albopictus]